MLIKTGIGGLLKKEDGGGLGTLFIGMAIVILSLLVLLNIADYSIFTYKRNAISRAMDYGVTAAVQQIDKNSSKGGMSRGFSESTGKTLLEEVELDIASANNVFQAIFYKNYNQSIVYISDNLLLCVTASHNGKLKYIIESENKAVLQGELDSPSMLEPIINQAVTRYWPQTEDDYKVYINGNPKTNMIENGTYLFALVKDVEITGLFGSRKIDLTSFAGAKLERVEGAEGL